MKNEVKAKSSLTVDVAKSKQVIALPIISVTVLEDRAKVIRRGKVDLSSVQQFIVEDVSPVISDTSLKVSLITSSALAVDPPQKSNSLKVADCFITRKVRVLDDSLIEKHLVLKDKVKAIDKEIKDTSGDIALLDQEAELSAELLERVLCEASEDVSWGQKLDTFLGSSISGIESQLIDNSAKHLDLAEQIEDLHEARRDICNQIAEMSSPQTKNSASVEFQLAGIDDSIKFVEVTIEYIVPGACWRPRHEAVILSADKGTSWNSNRKVKFSSSAAVWQNTGEDWANVELFFSTERASLGAVPPLLTEDSLLISKKTEKRVELREETISSFNVGGFDDSSDGPGDSATKKQSSTIPGIDDGGVVRLLKSETNLTIPSSGRPVVVPLSSFEVDCDYNLMVYPELSEAAFKKVVLENKSDQPLLAGPVYLVENGSYCGRTSIMYVASGDKFKLGLGTDPAIVCKRTVYRNEKKQKMLSSWICVDYITTLNLSSLAADKLKVVIEERIPVSEIDDVKITFDKDETTGTVKGPDKNGKVLWEITLAAQGTRKLELRYTVEKKADIDIL